jgi:hypothetical protein
LYVNRRGTGQGFKIGHFTGSKVLVKQGTVDRIDVLCRSGKEPKLLDRSRTEPKLLDRQGKEPKLLDRSRTEPKLLDRRGTEGA